jgi:superfamily II DNA or RNA helicase
MVGGLPGDAEASQHASRSGWASAPDDDEIRLWVGAQTFARGLAYQRSGAVLSSALSGNGRTLVASVRGSGNRRYRVTVTAGLVADPELGRGPRSWDSRCSCPMAADCKHVVAALLHTRARGGTASPAPVTAWEATFLDLARRAPAATVAPEVGLHFAMVTPRATRYAPAQPPVPSLRLRPVVRGKAGGWIRTGVSWRELEYGYGGIRLEPAHREVLLSFLATARTRAGGTYYGPENEVSAEQLGPALWRLLDDVQQAGVALVSSGTTEVQVEREPVPVTLDVRQPGPGADVTVTPQLQLPPRPTVDGGDHPALTYLGDPAHGVVLHGCGPLVLARFETPLHQALSRFVTAGDPVGIPASDLPRFLGLYYPGLRRQVRVESSDGSVAFPEVKPPKLVLRALFEPGHEALLRWSFRYVVGDESVTVPLVAGGQEPARDPEAEAALVADLSILDVVPTLRVPVDAKRRLLPEQRLRGLETATFVTEVLPVLEQREDVEVSVEGTPLAYAEADAAPLVTVSTSDAGVGETAASGDWFDLGITVTLGEEEVPFAPLFAALAKGQEHLILDSGTWFSLDRPELQALRRLIEEARSLQDRESDQLRISRWHAGLWEELVSLGVVAHQSARWSQSVGALLNLDEIPKPAPPAGLRAELRDYQKEGYHWLALLWDHRLGGVLADDMGLGKTLQTLAMAARAVEVGSLTPEAPLLIVAPTSVVSVWQHEVARFCPDLRVAVVTETQKRSGQRLQDSTAGAHLVVTSFALLRLDEEAYREQSWSGLVLDEAQFVKNHQAKTYQAARRLPAPFKLAITGTPLENSLMDLWALLSIVAPGLFPSPQRFTELYRRPIESGNAPELLHALRRRIRPLMLRRTKEQVAADLPPKVEQVLSVTLNPQHQRVYQTHLQRERQRVLGMLDDMQGNRIAILRSLTVLRQLSLDVSLVDGATAQKVRSSKIDALVEQLHELAGGGHRALVFSQFTGFLRLVRERLTNEGLQHVYLDGRTRDRPARVAEFTGGAAPVFLISLKAGGSGLTLTEADYVYVLDPWWNPATEAQAIDRTHRIGQDKPVMVYRLVAEGTIEEKVVELQQRKRDLFDRVLEADGLMGAPLTADDIRGLLQV